MTTTIETTERERIAFAAVELARHPERPRALQVIASITRTGPSCAATGSSVTTAQWSAAPHTSADAR